jgi:hypothetical protein
MRKLAEGKLSCPCGNNELSSFMFIQVGSLDIAGCKVCGCIFRFENGAWSYPKHLPVRAFLNQFDILKVYENI